MKVYVLTTSLTVTGDGGDYAGIVSVHSTPQGAIEDLHAWLVDVDVDVDEAYTGDLNDGFVGRDTVVESGPWQGAELSWHVNECTVHGL